MYTAKVTSYVPYYDAIDRIPTSIYQCTCHVITVACPLSTVTSPLSHRHCHIMQPLGPTYYLLHLGVRPDLPDLINSSHKPFLLFMWRTDAVSYISAGNHTWLNHAYRSSLNNHPSLWPLKVLGFTFMVYISYQCSQGNTEVTHNTHLTVTTNYTFNYHYTEWFFQWRDSDTRLGWVMGSRCACNQLKWMSKTLQLLLCANTHHRMSL